MADRDRDGILSWSEVQRFQNGLYRRYRYQSNGTALRPAEFLEASGGDCEDWALVTAALLHFWGIEAQIATIESETGAHAVTLVPVTAVPRGFLELTVPHRDTLEERHYVPIDYTQVGGLSSAVGERFTVTRTRSPDEIFGMVM